MAAKSGSHKAQVIFEQVISGRDGIKGRWPELSRAAANRDKLVSAFETAQRYPWTKDTRLAGISKQTARQALDFYNKVITDGRYVKELHTNPAEAAKRLNIKASPKVLGVMSAISSGLLSLPHANPGLVVVGGSVVVVGLAVAAAMTAHRHGPDHRILVDESGRVKLGDERAKRRLGSGKSKSKKKKKQTIG